MCKTQTDPPRWPKDNAVLLKLPNGLMYKLEKWRKRAGMNRVPAIRKLLRDALDREEE